MIVEGEYILHPDYNGELTSEHSSFTLLHTFHEFKLQMNTNHKSVIILKTTIRFKDDVVIVVLQSYM